MKTLFILASVMVVLFLAAPAKVEAQNKRIDDCAFCGTWEYVGNFNQGNETLLCNNWVFGHVTLTDRAQYVAYTQQLIIAEGRKQGIPQAQIDKVVRQVPAQITEKSINQPLKGSRMNFKDDHSVSVFMRLPTGEVRAAATWTLKGKELTIVTKGVGGASDSARVFELASVSKSQLVLTGHGITQTYISND